MCGIVGLARAGQAGVAEAAGVDSERCVRAMLARLAHRGPDGARDMAIPEAGAHLGHVRLSLNDLGDLGAQPLESCDGRLVITINGELYGFRETRAKLIAEGYAFRTRSDSEVALVLYQKHGLDFLKHLRGDFALALADRDAGRIVLARDRFGVRPLVYFQDDDLIVWASEAKSLFAHPRVPARIDRKAALNQLCQVMAPGTTAFEAVRSIHPGHALVIDREGEGLRVRDHCYWDLLFPDAAARPPQDLPEAGEFDGLRQLIVESLSMRLQADVPVAFYLSGGMDSSTLVGLGAGIAQHGRPRCFTIGFEDEAYDESGLAARMAQHVEAELTVLRVPAAGLYGVAYEAAVWHSERSFYNTLGVAKMALSRCVRQYGYKAVITGEGADELFAGYPAFRIDADAQGAGVQNEVFRGAILPISPERHLAFDGLCGFTPGWIQPWIASWRGAQGLLSEQSRDLLATYDPFAAVAETLDAEAIRGRGRLDVAQYTWIKTMLDGQILNWGGDKVDMANAVESRPVFLDHHLAEAAVRLPAGSRIHQGVEKWALRQAVKGALPAFMAERPKFAFMGPPGFRSSHSAIARNALIDKYLTENNIRGLGVCEFSAVSRFLKTIQDEPVENAELNQRDKLINHLLGLHILYAQFETESVETRRGLIHDQT